MAENSGTSDGSRRWIVLLGREDQPTDALVDYSKLLGEALEKRGYSLALVQFKWAERGWRAAWKQFSKQMDGRPGDWVLVQYTHLAWSRRGFPLRFPGLIRRLKQRGLRVVIVFHDPNLFGGTRLVDKLRSRLQQRVLRRSARLADRCISTIQPGSVAWMRDLPSRSKPRAIPVGSNLPSPADGAANQGKKATTVVVFGVTEGNRAESAMIGTVVARASEQVGPMRLIVFGRGSEAATETLSRVLQASRVRLEVLGILPPEQAAHVLGQADVQLFLRSGLSARRGSGIAGICRGLPIVGFADDETAFPITEAGVRLVPKGDQDAVVRELVHVISETGLRQSLQNRSLSAAKRYFSWDKIADEYLRVVGMTGD